MRKEKKIWNLLGNQHFLWPNKGFRVSHIFFISLFKAFGLSALWKNLILFQLHIFTLCIISFNRKTKRKYNHQSVNLAFLFLFISFIIAIFYSISPLTVGSFFLFFLDHFTRSSLHLHKTKCIFIYNSNFNLYYSVDEINGKKKNYSTAQLIAFVLNILCVCLYSSVDESLSLSLCLYVCCIGHALYLGQDNKFCFWRLQMPQIV